jgi:hypothetical protein
MQIGGVRCGSHHHAGQRAMHEWAKRQAARAGVSFRDLSNGFASCEDAAALQEICDRLGPGQIPVFAER